MGQVLHGSATTTEAVRRAIRRSRGSVRALAQRRGVGPTTVQKWRGRQTTADVAMGAKQPCSPVLPPEQEAAIVAFRRHMLLPLDDCLCALQPTIPALTRSSLHRCPQRHGISRLPGTEGDKPDKKRFKADPIGYLHIDVGPAQTASRFRWVRRTSPRSTPSRASCGCSWPSTAPASAPVPASWKARARWKRRSSCATWSRPCPTRSTPC